MERMGASKAWPAALTVTLAVSPAASLGIRASETWTASLSWSTPSMTATGAAVDTKPPFTAFSVRMVPETGERMLPRESMFSRELEICSRLDL